MQQGMMGDVYEMWSQHRRNYVHSVVSKNYVQVIVFTSLHR